MQSIISLLFTPRAYCPGQVFILRLQSSVNVQTHSRTVMLEFALKELSQRLFERFLHHLRDLLSKIFKNLCLLLLKASYLVFPVILNLCLTLSFAKIVVKSSWLIFLKTSNITGRFILIGIFICTKLITFLWSIGILRVATIVIVILVIWFVITVQELKENTFSLTILFQLFEILKQF